MKIENIPADIKSKSLKEARDEIDEILAKLETQNIDLSNTEKTMNYTFWLGVQPYLDKEHYDYITEKLEEFFGLNF